MFHSAISDENGKHGIPQPRPGLRLFRDNL